VPSRSQCVEAGIAVDSLRAATSLLILATEVTVSPLQRLSVFRCRQNCCVYGLAEKEEAGIHVFVGMHCLDATQKAQAKEEGLPAG